jgi:hypothetical protein
MVLCKRRLFYHGVACIGVSKELVILMRPLQTTVYSFTFEANKLNLGLVKKIKIRGHMTNPKIEAAEKAYALMQR